MLQAWDELYSNLHETPASWVQVQCIQRPSEQSDNPATTTQADGSTPIQQEYPLELAGPVQITCIATPANRVRANFPIITMLYE